MKTVGIIAEFNPFHNGHAYLLNKARLLTNADNVLVLMSGNYVQRGTPSFMDKFARSNIALSNGADVVLEFPLCYAMSSAAYFATGAINILNSLDSIDYLCFGCETDDINLLNMISDIIINEDDTYSSTIQSYLKTGLSFSKSREHAIIKSLSLNGINADADYLSSLISSPNVILAIEYLVALKRTNSKIIPVPVLRNDTGYHSTTVNEIYSSATAVRKLFSGKSVFTFNNVKESLSRMIPSNAMELFETEFKKTYPVTAEDFSTLVGDRLYQAKHGLFELSALFDNTDDLANRILNLTDSYTSISGFVNDCNSKIFTSSRITRLLMYTLINYTKDDYFTFKNDGYVYYYRMLGFKKSSEPLLTQIKANSDFPIITKISNSYDSLSTNGKRMLGMNMLADDLYRMVVMNKYNTIIPNEHQYGVIVQNDSAYI